MSFVLWSIRRSVTFAALTLALAALLASQAPAAKPGGGGGTATGKIFFSSGGTLFSMNADGSNKQPAEAYGGPSPTLYGGHRWFVERRYSEASLFREYWLVREDGVEHQLAIDADLDLLYLNWGPEGTLVGTGRRWVVDGTVDPESCGLYLAVVAFDADGNLVDYVPPVQFGHVGLDVEQSTGEPITAARAIACSPDLGRVVYDHWDSGELWMLDVPTGETWQVATYGRNPDWSPDGALIAFAGSYGIETIRPDGTGQKLITRVKSHQYVMEPHFSPGSSHIVYTVGTYLGYPGDDQWEIYSVTASGSGKTSLTGDISTSAGAWDWTE